jgi:hypothetical protein
MSILPSGGKTKKKLIWELLEKGNYTPQDIAGIVRTPVDNVYKETSLYRKSHSKVVVEKSRKTGVIMSASGRRQEISKTEKVRLEVETNNHISAPPLEAEDLKVLYGDFQSGKSPVDVVVMRGFHPEAVEIEYRRYLRLSNQDRPKLIERIVEGVVTARSDSIDRIKGKYYSSGTLDNTELDMLLRLNNNEQLRNGEAELMAKISSGSGNLPDEFYRPSCHICGAPVPGILVRRDSHAAREMASVDLSCPAHRAR